MQIGKELIEYRAFICYAHDDIIQAAALESAILKFENEELQTPVRIFKDDSVIKLGEDLPSSIKMGLENSEYLILLASKKAAESPWVSEEVRIWCAKSQRRNKILILLLEGNIETDLNKINWDKTDALPSILKGNLDFLPNYEKLRWAQKDIDRILENKKYREIIIKICASFRGISPLEMHEEWRQKKEKKCTD